MNFDSNWYDSLTQENIEYTNLQIILQLLKSRCLTPKRPTKNASRDSTRKGSGNVDKLWCLAINQLLWSFRLIRLSPLQWNNSRSLIVNHPMLQL